MGSNFYIQPNMYKEIKFQILFPFLWYIYKYTSVVFRCEEVVREQMLSCSRAGCSKTIYWVYGYKVVYYFVEEDDACSYSPFL